MGSEFQESMAPDKSTLFSRVAIGIATSYDKNLYNLNVNKVTKYFDRGTDHLTNDATLNHLTYISRKIGQSQTNHGDNL